MDNQNFEQLNNDEGQATGSILDKVMASQNQQARAQYEPVSLLSEFHKILTPREANVLNHRFGLFEHPEETLESLGKKHNITRERVRQIERQAIEKIRREKQFEATIDIAHNAVHSVLEECGGIMEEKHLLEELHSHLEVSIAIEKASFFIIKALLSERIQQITPGDFLRAGWGHKNASLDFVKQLIQEAIQLIESKGQPISFNDFVDIFKEKPFYKENQETLSEQWILSALRLSQMLEQNVFGDWGLVVWTSITPKRMGDKSYLVLKKYGEPLHFKEVAEYINKYRFDHKTAYPETVHNELIIDDRFVLVGRGMYALAEWGYKPGIVADVLVDILKTRGEPMSKEELIEQVMKQRMVKKETVYLSLTDRNKFERLPSGKYTLILEQK